MSDYYNIDADMESYNKVKELVIGRLIDEGTITEEEGIEFCNRVILLKYKARWFKKWVERFTSNDNNMDSETEKKWYITLVDKKPREFPDEDNDRNEEVSEERRRKLREVVKAISSDENEERE